MFYTNPATLYPHFVKKGWPELLVADQMRKTVAFLGFKIDGNFTPKATCFFVSILENGFHCIFLVTADHVAAQMRATGKEIWLRTNKKDGSTEEIVIPDENWIHFSNQNPTDIAAVPIAFDGSEDVHTVGIYGFVNQHMIVDQETIIKENIGIGEEIVIVGMFRSHYGLNRNIPVVRIGNIAAMAEEPVPTKDYGFVDAYLVEARSIGGLSGSPVFVNMPPYRVIQGQITISSGPQYYLLGLMHGHFDIPDMNADVVIDDSRGSVNTGMGVVIPATKIVDLLRQEDLVAERQVAIQQYFAQKGATPD